ncbi:hypothetical protein E6C76_02725 [Pseudothauera nasutitermitis]|uniref:Uncharacterized protein n=1 Tax=Pseudothauera nasutitermitis TaxID=2565930 RepID=A0A4S4B3Q0_9RHOO|nr:hypothetical protein [Pseudothauera nasutitermitis]THF67307.1 hypothetical protein E6C76_02725 [Pseudothauera nasutitermitis]
MSQFKLEKQLPSCTVSKDLLRELEAYLLAKAKALAGDEVLEEGRHFRVRIHDDLGVETISTVDSIPGGQFLDSTSQVALELDLRYGKTSFPLEVDIRFNKDRSFSKLTIAYSGDDARSVVAGLNDGVLRLVLSAKNGNRFFNPPPAFEGALWVATSLPLFAGSVIEKTLPSGFAFGALLAALMYAYLIAGKRLRPYTAFDTPSTERNSKIVEWFIYGLAGFLVFGTLFVVLRKSAIGF